MATDTRTYLRHYMIGGLRNGHDQFMLDMDEVERETGAKEPSELLSVLGEGWKSRPGPCAGHVIFQRSISAETAIARLEAAVAMS